MTKLMEWLVSAVLIFSIWLALLTRKIESENASEYKHLIMISPIICVFLFGLYAATTVLYRTFTFNNCEEAAVELKKEVEIARRDLKEKGYVF